MDGQGRQQQSRGPAPAPIWRFQARWGLGDHATCPKPMLPLDWGTLLALHGAWLLGTLAAPGGLLDQPAAYVDAMHLIESERTAIERHKLKEKQREAGLEV